MTDSELRELDAQIAVEVFGDTLIKVHAVKSDPLVLMRKARPDELGIYNRFYLEDGTKLYCGKPFAPEKIEYYSIDMRAAWKVVEWLRNRWGQLHLVAGLEWHCFPDDDLTHYGIGSGETPELAICRAALAAVRARKETTPC